MAIGWKLEAEPRFRGKDVSQDASQDFSKGIFAKQSYNVSYLVSAK